MCILVDGTSRTPIIKWIKSRFPPYYGTGQPGIPLLFRMVYSSLTPLCKDRPRPLRNWYWMAQSTHSFSYCSYRAGLVMALSAPLSPLFKLPNGTVLGSPTIDTVLHDVQSAPKQSQREPQFLLASFLRGYNSNALLQQPGSELKGTFRLSWKA